MKKMFLTFAAALVMVAVSAQPQGGQGGPQGGQMPEGFQQMMESMQKIQTERNTALKALMTGDQVAKFDTWAQQQGQMMGGRGQRPEGGQGGPQGGQGGPQGEMPQGGSQGGPQGEMPQGGQGGPQGGQGGPQGGQGGPQGGRGMNSEAMIQAQIESLNQAVTLTDDQKTKATAIFQDAAKKQQELMSQMRPQGQGAPQQN